MSLRAVNLSGANLSNAQLNEANLAGAVLNEAILRNAHLVGANLIGAHLNSADLVRADLREASLRRGHLSQADLRETNLSGVALRYAHLHRANLSRARLMGANLRDADLREVDLTWANLSDGLLCGARCDGAILAGTVFGSVDLRQTEGLETCRHWGPSVIDHRTFTKSGSLPLKFLRGCGLPDWLIEAYKLTNDGLSASQVTDIGYEVIRRRSDPVIRYHSCFISYSSHDGSFARRLHDDLQDAGVRCWFAPEDIKAGRKIRQQISEAIHLHDKLFLILSEHSMQSNWVEAEIRRARKRERTEGRPVLFPVRLVSYEALQDWDLFDTDEGRDLAVEVREYFIPDFSNWQDEDSYQRAFQRLLRDLKADRSAPDG